MTRLVKRLILLETAISSKRMILDMILWSRMRHTNIHVYEIQCNRLDLHWISYTWILVCLFIDHNIMSKIDPSIDRFGCVVIAFWSMDRRVVVYRWNYRMHEIAWLYRINEETIWDESMEGSMLGMLMWSMKRHTNIQVYEIQCRSDLLHWISCVVCLILNHNIMSKIDPSIDLMYEIVIEKNDKRTRQSSCCFGMGFWQGWEILMLTRIW